MNDAAHPDPAALLVSVLADQIADRLADRLGPKLAELAEPEPQPHPPPRHEPEPDDGLWSASRVAAHYDVAVRFVYQHAEELGCVRLGGGQRPRLRFDPDVVRERWPHMTDMPEQAAQRRRRTPPQRGARRTQRPGLQLIDFDREP